VQLAAFVGSVLNRTQRNSVENRVYLVLIVAQRDREANGRVKTGRISDALPSDVIGGAMINASSDHGQAQRHVENPYLVATVR